MDSIANRIQQALLKRNLKQSDLVSLTGIGKSSISTYLSGDYEPKQRNIYKIAKALEVNEAWIMGLDVPMEREKPTTVTDDELLRKIELRPDLRELLEIMSTASDEGLSTLVRLAKMIDKEKQDN